ncbi:MAG: gliding motility protein GldN [Bacteroidetes bacterium]|nr:gliding motility protein GldN [Bacteroidota bacterium]
MKRTAFFMVFLGCVFTIAYVDAQQRPVRRRNSYGDNNGAQQTQNNKGQQPNTYGNADTTGTGNAPNNYSNNAGGMSIDTSLPITVIKGSGNGLLDSTKLSLRPDGAFSQNLVKDMTPLPYEDIREDDAVFRVRVWREIDAREKMNLPFRYAGVEDNGSQRFISILLRAIKDGDVTAFSADDDRFTTPITADDAINAFGGGYDTVKVYDDDGNVKGYQVRPRATDPDSIYKFRLKEDWIFDKESSRLYVRIIGIAPVIPYKLSTGDIVPNSERPVWWVYYPDLRPVLAKYDVYNPRNLGAEMSWEELFESRMFSSYIVKSTVNNPFDLPLSQVYPNNTLFRLLEGEKVKDKIFNYEQSLWSY